MAVEEQKHIERLILRRGRNTMLSRQVPQKRLGIFAVQFVRRFAPYETLELPHPQAVTGKRLR
jgi:hypothetical protein